MHEESRIDSRLIGGGRPETRLNDYINNNDDKYDRRAVVRFICAIRSAFEPVSFSGGIKQLSDNTGVLSQSSRLFATTDSAIGRYEPIFKRLDHSIPL